jgi:hypothetical protein
MAVPGLSRVGLCFVLLTAGCCAQPPLRTGCDVVTLEHNGAAAIAVAEQQVRSPDLALPLAAAEREKLVAFLVAGGNNDALGEDAVIPNAGTRYAGLLDSLANPELLDLEDLKGAPYTAWFKASVTQVIDAREPRPAVLGSVYAATDGPYWWVFRREGSGKLNRLVVFKALGDNR